jgi:hypothetical protein
MRCEATVFRKEYPKNALCKNKTRGRNFPYCYAHRKAYHCLTCFDAGFATVKGKSTVLPCPNCNPDGMNLEEDPS